MTDRPARFGGPVQLYRLRNARRPVDRRGICLSGAHDGPFRARRYDTQIGA